MQCQLMRTSHLTRSIAPSCFAASAAGGSTTSGNVTPGKTLTGKATYYSDRLNGHETAKGDTFHQSAHTAASNKLPLGTTAKVTNLKTGKSTDVTVTDRGPALGQLKLRDLGHGIVGFEVSADAQPSSGVRLLHGRFRLPVTPAKLQQSPCRTALRAPSLATAAIAVPRAERLF
jgi:hypothetical protein